MAADDVLTLSCPAKVNLALSVGGPDERGLHPIVSWMVALSFADELTLRRADGDESTFDIAFAADAPVARTVDWPAEQDLTFRAHAALQEHVGRSLGVNLTLRKRIPTGGGLGGGSSNAASTLVGLNRLFELGLDECTLMQLAAKLGSDVAFFVAAANGQSSAIVSGLGELVEPAPLPEVIHLVLAFPAFGCPTGLVYSAFDQLHPDAGPADAERVRSLRATMPVPQDGPFNDLAEPAMRVQPQLAKLLAAAREKMDIPLHVSGSGSTLFAIAPSAITAKPLARKVTALTGLPAVATRTV